MIRVDQRQHADEAPRGDPDAALVLRARQDPAAFAALYERYVQLVYRYCLRRLGDPETAEDATAQTFTKALAAVPTYRAEGVSFRSWLFAIAHNVLVDLHRRHRLHEVLSPAVNDPAPGPEELALAADRRRQLHEVLALVPDDQRRILELRVAGLTTEEIAHVLGSSPGAVRTRQCRAVKRLRLALGIERDLEAHHG